MVTLSSLPASLLTETVEPAVEELSAHGPVHGVPADLTSAEEVGRLCREVEALIDGYFESEEPTSLLQRFERPEEVARVVVFLCSEAAAVVNGSAQRAEGGIIRSAL